ncbi:hypothetical protein AMTR_s00112p00144280, partial [Amborella trichopoda]
YRLDVDYQSKVDSLYEEIDSFIKEVNGESSSFKARGKQGRQQSHRQGKESSPSRIETTLQASPSASSIELIVRVDRRTVSC